MEKVLHEGSYVGRGGAGCYVSVGVGLGRI